MTTSTDAARQPAAAFADAMNAWTRTWMGTWQQAADAMLRGAFPATGCEASAQRSASGAPAFPFGMKGLDEAFQPVRRQMTSQVSTLLRGMIDLTTANSATLTAIGGEQIHFAARPGERGGDCVRGAQPARTPEAFLATAQAMNSDLLENAAIVGERLAKLGTQGMERVSELLGATATAAKTCCGGSCESQSA